MLELRGLSVRYGGAIALQDVSLTTGGAHVVAVLGTNGAGKSSLGLAVCGLIPYQGSALFDGILLDDSDAPERVRRGVVYVPEGRRIFPSMSVLDNLRIGAYAVAHQDWRVRADRLLDEMPTIGRRSGSLGGLLSGGEQQLLAIARALMASPRMLVLDEPSLGLSPMGLREVRQVLERLVREEGLRVLLLEQNVTFSSQVAEVIYVLRLGRVVARLDGTSISDAAAIRGLFLGIDGAGSAEGTTGSSLASMSSITREED